MATATAPTVDDLIDYARAIAPQIGMANDTEVANPDRQKTRNALADDWSKMGLPMFKAARIACPSARGQIVAATEAIAHAIIRGAPGDTAAFGSALHDLQCAPLEGDGAAADNRQADTKTDTPKKKLKMNAAAAGAAKLYRDTRPHDPTYTLKQACIDYAEQHGGSASYIERVLSDNPDQWRI